MQNVIRVENGKYIGEGVDTSVIGNLQDLTTTDKSSVVGAINEVNGAVAISQTTDTVTSIASQATATITLTQPVDTSYSWYPICGNADTPTIFFTGFTGTSATIFNSYSSTLSNRAINILWIGAKR